jgi:hypothetical protein
MSGMYHSTRLTGTKRALSGTGCCSGHSVDYQPFWAELATSFISVPVLLLCQWHNALGTCMACAQTNDCAVRIWVPVTLSLPLYDVLTSSQLACLDLLCL